VADADAVVTGAVAGVADLVPVLLQAAMTTAIAAATA